MKLSLDKKDESRGSFASGISNREKAREAFLVSEAESFDDMRLKILLQRAMRADAAPERLKSAVRNMLRE